MWWKTLVIAVVSGILYRLGGVGKPWNTKVRDFGVPVVAIALLYWLGMNLVWYHWVNWLSFGVMFAAMTTYCEYWGDRNYVAWYEWMLTGCMYGCTGLFYAWKMGTWSGFGWRVLALTILIPAWSVLVRKDTWNEFGRGFLFTATLPLIVS